MVLSLVLFGCATQQLRPDRRAVEGSATQSIYRVRYQVPGEQGDVRLTLRRWSQDRFQLTVSDSLGGRLWTAMVGGGEAVLLNHHTRQYCRGFQYFRLPEIGQLRLPIRSLPDVLAGRSPWQIPQGETRPGRLTSDDGRALTLEWSAEGLRKWTLWESDRPVLWWQGTARSGILSRPGGFQLRWRLSVREPLASDAPSLEVPPRYALVDCGHRGFHASP